MNFLKFFIDIIDRWKLKRKMNKKIKMLKKKDPYIYK